MAKKINKDVWFIVGILVLAGIATAIIYFLNKPATLSISAPSAGNSSSDNSNGNCTAPVQPNTTDAAAWNIYDTAVKKYNYCTAKKAEEQAHLNYLKNKTSETLAIWNSHQLVLDQAKKRAGL